MKRVAIKILAAITAAMVYLPLHAFLAGEGMRAEPAAVTPAAAVLEIAAPVPVPPDAFEITKERAEFVAADCVQVAQAAEPDLNENMLPADATAGIDDKDPVSLLQFGKELLAGYLAGINNLTSRLADTGGAMPEFIFEYDDNAGVRQTIYMGMYYDEKNQLIIGRDQQGAFAFGFDVDLRQKMLYSSLNGWNRSVGFNRIYDFLAPAAGVFYDTHRIKFEYAGQDWMVQIWKGLHFFVGSGAEIGIYNKPKSRTLEHYDCAGEAETLEMSMRVLRGDDILLERAPQKHWWMNGFVLSTGVYPPSALTLAGSIRFEDEGMKAAFLVPFEALCAREGITFTVDGGLISFVW